ncbi:type 2 lanthipeptide synthetase LanM family protein [Streptomyces sp. NPDC002643]
MIDSSSAADPVVAPDVLGVPWELAAYVPERACGRIPPEGIDGEAGRTRFDGWKRMVPFRGTPIEVDAALSPFGVGAAELTALLGEDREALRKRSGERPEWTYDFTEAWREHHAGAGAGAGAGATAPAADRSGSLPDDLGFLELSRPLLTHARTALLRDLAPLAERIAAVPELAALPELLADSLPLRALGLGVRRMCVLELNVARVAGRLVGDSPEDRLRDFRRLLCDPEYALGLWRAYPVLARHQVDLLNTWRAARVEFATRLLTDFSALVETVWDGKRPGAVEAVDFGAGDTHRGGRSVAVVRFADARVVHKPRSLDIDLAFNRYLEWFDGHRPPHRLRMPRVLDRRDHGWVEFIAHEACADADEVSAFYWRTGALLALLHSLGATDFHLENVIAAGESPVAIDLEALFHTRPAESRTGPGRAGGHPPTGVGAAAGRGPASHADPAAEALESSVLSVGLLPKPLMVRDEESDRFHLVDMSGIAAAETVSSAAPVAVVEAANTDEMRIVRRHITHPGAANRPRLADGTPLDPLAHREQVIEGFVFAYERIRADRPELLRAGGLIDGFLGSRTRLILRPTRTYARLLEESTHPDFLRDALDRDRSLARLCQGLHDGPTRYPLMAAEIRALRAGDIPLFTTRPGSRDVWLDNGDRVADVLPAPPIDAVRDRVHRMSDTDLAFQLRMMETSYDIAQASLRPRPAAPELRPVPSHGVSGDELVECAEEIGLRLMNAALRDGDRIGWPGLSWADENHWRIEPAGHDLYQGLPGIGMFLTYLAAETDRPLWRERARLVAGATAARLGEFAERYGGLPAGLGFHRSAGDSVGRSPSGTFPGKGTGYFGEAAGAVNFLLHAGRVLGDSALFAPVTEALPVLERLLPYDKAHDVVAGNAGLLLTLLAVHEVLPEAGALPIARSCADTLIDGRVSTEHGCGWPAPAVRGTPLAGMAHGTAGIALALARLHRISPGHRYADTIEAALRHENSLYDPDLGNWRDLRALPDHMRARSTHAWCHGAPGIGLARHEMLSCGLPEQLRTTVETDLATALRATWRVMAGVDGDGCLGVGNHTICHGDLGNVELLAVAGRTAQLPVRPEQLIAAVLDDARRGGWRCGLRSGSAAVGLMPGMAGIGYQLLHLAHPDRVPSILRMQPPRRVPPKTRRSRP